ncbi:hypothetical protein DPMN_054444 [Dreissena polymorpha]|uniref:Uncharacterized protein n=1 Tax=Dreissena polymorpha TaxID=45954 RepID=A0A9D4HPS1_DREPO|nr:hypothetical protein DPMN_054444 [Dreissena polymorpha]
MRSKCALVEEFISGSRVLERARLLRKRSVDSLQIHLLSAPKALRRLSDRQQSSPKSQNDFVSTLSILVTEAKIFIRLPPTPVEVLLCIAAQVRRPLLSFLFQRSSEIAIRLRTMSILLSDNFPSSGSQQVRGRERPTRWITMLAG